MKGHCIYICKFVVINLFIFNQQFELYLMIIVAKSFFFNNDQLDT